MANFVYVDNSNVWIEGMRVSAVERGFAPDIWAAVENKIQDNGWRIDFGRLHEFAGGGDIGRAVLYGSRPPANDTLWRIAEQKGFEVVVEARNVANREKKIDTTIVRDIMRDFFTRMKEGDEATLVAGDADYVLVVEDLTQRGFRFEVVFWSHASGQLKGACSKFVALNAYLEHLRLS